MSLVTMLWSTTTPAKILDCIEVQPGPRVLLLPLPGVFLRHGEAGEELGHVGQLCDGLDQLGGRHQDNGGRVGGQGPQGLVAGVAVTDILVPGPSHF